MIGLFTYLNSIHPLSAEAEGAMMKVLRQKELRKGQIWLQQGSVCDKFCFMEKGLAKIYFESGSKECVIGYTLQNDILLSAKSYFLQTPSEFSIRAIAPCVISYFQYADIQYLLSKYTELNIHLRIIMQHCLALYETHLALMMMNPRERYEKMLSLYPGIINGTRFTDRMLAAYIGVTHNCWSGYKNGG